ncbi:hypothetical protein ACP70R_000554 [Stipagrostis hirtigluma subsp. patula]
MPRGRTGNDGRLMTQGLGSIQQAIIISASGHVGPIFMPKIGDVYDSAEEAFDFYNMHSWESGFGIRYGRNTRNTKGSDHRPNRATIRTGCRAMVRLHRTDDDGWYISIFNSDHNHAMSLSNVEKRQWRSHNRIDPIDASFVYEVDVDKNGRMRSIMWVTGRSQLLYSNFGDVVTFDTTYRTNIYNMPFGLFVGVNNHFQSIIFGGVLFREETIDAFTWAFKTFTRIMGGQQPLTILTDQCHQMAVAIVKCWPNTRHCWCKWHMLRKAKENMMISTSEFENRWKHLLTKYGLENNKYLQRAYDYRHMWAKPYFSNIFCAGMTSTQRSESANHMLKRFVTRSCPMHQFVLQFNKLLAERHAEEAREEHATNKVARPMRFGFPLEKHAAEIYSRAIFNKFADQMYLSGSLTISSTDVAGHFIVNDPSEPETPSFFLAAEPYSNSLKCSCQMFEHCGMMCKHMIKVLLHLEAHEVPSSCILDRWRRKCAMQHGLVPYVTTPQGSFNPVLHRSVHITAMGLIHSANQAPGGLQVLMKHLEEAKKSLANDMMLPGKPADERFYVGTNGTEFKSPLRVKSKGRPAHKRIKTWAEKNKKLKARLGTLREDGNSAGSSIRVSD